MPQPKPKKRRVKGFAPRGLGKKWILVLLVVLLLIPAMQVAVVRFINPPWTLPMLIEQGSAVFSSAPKHPLRYRWIALPQIPEMFLKHLWISEDQRFFQHEGFDWKEMDLAVKEAERKGKPVRGASTITNQCARSIFLWQGRSWIRKGLESVLHDLDGGAVAEAAHPGAVCKRDRDGTRDLRSRSSLAALFRRQRARSYAGPIGNTGGRPAESERVGSDEAGQNVALASAPYSATGTERELPREVASVRHSPP